jgi:hypothetical protein
MHASNDVEVEITKQCYPNLAQLDVEYPTEKAVEHLSFRRFRKYE